MINARSETVENKPSYRHAFLKKRCIIPKDSFFYMSGKYNRMVMSDPNNVIYALGATFPFKSTKSTFIKKTNKRIEYQIII
jgi:putative SOS response-associated peptidase YedK